MISKACRTAGLVLGLSLSIRPAWPQNAPAYRVSSIVVLGAPDRWDFLTFDPASHRVYVAHGDRVSIVDGQDGKLVGEVKGVTGGTHGIAVAMGKGFTDDGKAGLAIPFDLTSFEKGQPIKVDADADTVAVDPSTGHVFVIDGDPGKISVIDPANDVVTATIDGGGKLEFAVADGKGDLYVNGEARREIVRVDTKTNMVSARWPMPDCESPHGLAIDKASRRLFATCVNQRMVIMNADTGGIVATVPIGKGSDAAAFDPKRRLAFSSNGLDGTLSIIKETDAGRFVPLETIKTMVSGRTMSLDPETGRLYIAAAETGRSSTPGGRPKALPGSLRLLFLDPSGR